MGVGNNLLIYYGVPITGIAGVNDITRAGAILATYNYVVIKRHTGANLTNLRSVLRTAVEINPGMKIYGYTSLGDAASYSTWQSAAQQWSTDIGGALNTKGDSLGTGLGTGGIIHGIFIDNFSEADGVGTATRSNQNSAVNYLHSTLTGGGWEVMVSSPSNLYSIFEAQFDVDSAVPAIGLHAYITDSVFLPNYRLIGAGSNTAPTIEPAEDTTGRAQYMVGARTNHGLKLRIFYGANAGNLTQISQGDYSVLQNALTSVGGDGVTVSPYDYSAATALYFSSYFSNTFQTINAQNARAKQCRAADLFMDFEVSVAGTPITAALMTTDTIVGPALGSWSTTPSTPTLLKIDSNDGGPMQVYVVVNNADGLPHDGSGGSRNLTYFFNNGSTDNVIQFNFSSTYTRITVGCFITTFLNGDTFSLFDAIQIEAVSGVEAVAQFQDGTNANFGWQAHCAVPTHYGKTIPIQRGKKYWITLLFDSTLGKCIMRVYDPVTWLLIDESDTIQGNSGLGDGGGAMTTGSPANRVIFGTNSHNASSSTLNSCSMRFDQIIVDFSNGAFPAGIAPVLPAI
jgi:hypothetical protein